MTSRSLSLPCFHENECRDCIYLGSHNPNINPQSDGALKLFLCAKDQETLVVKHAKDENEYTSMKYKLVRHFLNGDHPDAKDPLSVGLRAAVAQGLLPPKSDEPLEDYLIGQTPLFLLDSFQKEPKKS